MEGDCRFPYREIYRWRWYCFGFQAAAWSAAGFARLQREETGKRKGPLSKTAQSPFEAPGSKSPRDDEMVVAFLLKKGRRMAISVWLGRPDGSLLCERRGRPEEQGVYVDRGLISDRNAPNRAAKPAQPSPLANPPDRFPLPIRAA